MNGKIELEDETITLFQHMGSVVNTADGKTYYFLPYWLECAPDNEKTFIMHALGKLPDDLTQAIQSNREL